MNTAWGVENRERGSGEGVAYIDHEFHFGYVECEMFVGYLGDVFGCETDICS